MRKAIAVSLVISITLLMVMPAALAVCDEDNICDSEEMKSCPDCSLSTEVQCYEDGKCTSGEMELGNCTDCTASEGGSQAESKGETDTESAGTNVPVTGLVAVGGIGLSSLLVLFVIVALVMVFLRRGKGSGDTPLSG